MRRSGRILSAACLIFLALASSDNLINAFHVREPVRGDTQLSRDKGLSKTQPGGYLGEQGLQPAGSDREILSQLAQQSLGANGSYQLIWEPNKVQGSVHTVAVRGSIVAIGAGFLYDNEIHIYRWNASIPGPAGLTHAFDIGDGLLHGDVLSLTFGDTDRDGFLEIIAGTADGGIYVFEQENRTFTSPSYYQFQLVWSTNVGKRVTSVAVDDLDSDGLSDIVVGSWTGKVYVYEYRARLGTPGNLDHQHYYELVWDSNATIAGLVTAVATGDTDNDGFREIIAGASDHRVYIFENANATTPGPTFPHADNSFVQVWNSGDQIPGPIQTLTVSNFLDQDNYGEIAVTSPGHGAYVFDYQPSTGEYSVSKLMRPLESWEQDPPFPIDHYIDLKTSGDNSTGVVEPWEGTGPCGQGSSCCEQGLSYSTFCQLGVNATAIAGVPDVFLPRSEFPYSFPFGATLLNATRTTSGLARVTLDFGKDEEVTGGGDSRPDLTIYGLEIEPHNTTLDNLRVYFSRDGTNFTQVRNGLEITKVEAPCNVRPLQCFRRFNVTIDVDPMTSQLGWEWFRYVKLTTVSEFYVDAIIGSTLYRPVTDAVSASITFDPTLGRVLLIGTAQGTLKAFASNGTLYNQIWDSYGRIPLCQPGTSILAGNCQYRTRFSLDTNIWSIAVARNFFVLGTNSKINFVEIDPATLEAKVDWDTGSVLDKWSMSVTLADTDGDGQNEVIVGSFDNNIYVFHHVFRSTYTKAWRSPDLVHNQTIWDHVSRVMVADYDSDGKQELLAANDNQTYPIVYVFRPDPAAGPSQFSLSENETLYLPKDSGPIAGMDLGNDLNQDGVKEVVVAAARSIGLFERVGGNTIKSSLPALLFSSRILAVATGDPDGDGRGDIIFGGWYSLLLSISLPATKSMFLVDWEYNSSIRGFSPVWSPESAHLSRPPSSMSIAISYQDRNGKNEIIVGHDFGINVYENTGDNIYTTKQIITSSAIYPYYSPRQVVNLPDNYAPGPVNTYEGWLRSSAPVVQLSNKTFLAIYTGIDPTVVGLRMNQSRIIYQTSQDGLTWSSPRRLTNDTQYTQDNQYPQYTRLGCGNFGSVYYERNPAAAVIGNSVYVTYEAETALPAETIFSRSPCVYVTRLGTSLPTLDLSRVATGAISPSIFVNSTDLAQPSPTLALTYLNYTRSGIGAKMLFLNQSEWATTVVASIAYSYPRWINALGPQNTAIGVSFQAFSEKTTSLQDGTLAAVFDGYDETSGRNDTNIWVMILKSTGSGQPDGGSWSKPRWLSALTFNQTRSSLPPLGSIGVVVTSRGELAPSISVLKGNVLAVVYQEAEFPLEPRSIIKSSLYITVSADGGSIWTDPQLLPTGSGLPYASTIAGLVDGGYILSYHTSLSGVSPSSPKIFVASNLLDGWWRYTLGPVEALALGDTNGNRVSEIIAGSLNRVYVLELADAGNGNLVYQEKWTSQPLVSNVTDIAIGDINGDSTPEIVVTAKSGNLYAFEWITNDIFP